MPNRENRRAAEADAGGAPVRLTANGIEKSYGSWSPFGGETTVLRGASLRLHAGEIVGIVGENGSGKSTLLSTLVGSIRPDAGSVTVDGSIGWCPQEPRLYDRLTVRETFRLFGTAHGMSETAIADATERLAEQLDFERFLDRRVDRLSGGNRQKVNLGVSVMHDPAVLLLDEPYTGFDWETYLAFWELTETLTDRGTAIAVVSHFVNERERFDRVLRLRDGRLASVDTTESEATPTDCEADPTPTASVDRGGDDRE